MNKRYTLAITKNPEAGEGMISILIIDTRPVNGKSEIYSKTVHKSEKVSALHPYMEMYGDDIHMVDISS